eukprot:CAMPEP_0118697096 /NCGR_PEP_ID=MMETSP0800-20121206/14272_1 /TAXON_ID=210618 ORGANISM="Striatella unipunctata, Strain CCMP2910" /NCGR_SAMPLE_ID=MMETSP0800 /ASSEMBLY_ACC=CAM_ASM_000638 /LENGTH=152 /DNA_ID=CAMNT_0006596401 /DNA_START=170 /DNA_END=628 /DNA_ORIENTATION=+
MENPCSMAVVDTVFYGLDSNPSRNRRHVLEQYCAYIETRYPRRCCHNDDDTTTTTTHPPPTLTSIVLLRDACPICGNQDAPITGTKITVRVVDRALKPILGMFYGLPGAAKAWRHMLQEESRCLERRNCGPAFLIRRCVANMPDHLLDAPFV